jgi:hypothetical protein
LVFQKVGLDVIKVGIFGPLVDSVGLGFSDVGFQLLEESNNSVQGFGGDGDGGVLGDLDQSIHNWNHFLVEFVLDGGSEDLVQLLGDLEEEVGVAVEGGLSIGELSDDVVGGSDVVKGVLVLFGSVGVGGGEDLVLLL